MDIFSYRCGMSEKLSDNELMLVYVPTHFYDLLFQYEAWGGESRIPSLSSSNTLNSLVLYRMPVALKNQLFFV